MWEISVWSLRNSTNKLKLVPHTATSSSFADCGTSFSLFVEGVQHLQLHPLQLTIQRLALDPQYLRRPALVPARRRQHLADLFGFRVSQCLDRMISWLHRRQRIAHSLAIDPLIWCQNDQPFDQ